MGGFPGNSFFDFLGDFGIPMNPQTTLDPLDPWGRLSGFGKFKAKGWGFRVRSCSSSPALAFRAVPELVSAH